MQLCIRNIYKHFDKKTVLDHTSFIFQEGSIYSILGRNGAGKTTLFCCISGDLLFEDGEVTLEDNGVSRSLTFEDVGIVSASPVLPDFLTGYEFIHFFVKLNREKELTASIDSYFDLVHIEEEDRHKLIKNYSYGMKNKLQLMCCLIRNPKVILLDEPLSSFDIIVSHDIKELLLGMKEGHIIIMATHIIQLAQDMSDKIVLLRKGILEAVKETDLQDDGFEDYIIRALQEKPQREAVSIAEKGVQAAESAREKETQAAEDVQENPSEVSEKNLRKRKKSGENDPTEERRRK